MAGVIQLGDAIKFAELAWTVWEYGWAREHNAGQFAVSLYCQPSPKLLPSLFLSVAMALGFKPRVLRAEPATSFLLFPYR